MALQGGVLAFKRMIIIMAGFVGLVVGFMSLAGFVPGNWVCDQLSQFRLAYCPILTFCVLLLLLAHARGCALLVGMFLLANLLPLGLLMIPPHHSVKHDEMISKSDTVKILDFNTEFQHNENWKEFAELVSQFQPDLVILIETDQKWISNLAPTLKAYPYNHILIEGPGLALFSKYPILRTSSRKFGKSHHPRIIDAIRIGEKEVSIVLAHPTTPKSSSGYLERNQELQILASELKELPKPILVVADLNCGPWSNEFSKLLGNELIDSERGFGPQPSWPARIGRVIEGLPIPPLVPIDHVLCSSDIQVVERRTGPAIGSDHLPVLIKLNLQSSDK